MDPLRYFAAYPPGVQQQVRELIDGQRLDGYLQQRYPGRHQVRSDKALYDYVQDLKAEFLRNAEPINKVAFDSKIHVINHALGLHTQQQGSATATASVSGPTRPTNISPTST